jgi:hypothetical protein
MNSLLRKDERQLSKKRPSISSSSISNFFVAKRPFKKQHVQQKQNLENLGLLNVFYSL